MNLIKIYQDSHIDPDIQANPRLISAIDQSTPLHTHDFFEFFLIISGACIHYVNGKEQYLSKGSLVFIRPDDIHFYGYYGNEDCQFINVPCSNEVITSTVAYLGDSCQFSRLTGPGLPPVALLSPAATDNFIMRYEKLIMLSTIDKAQARLHLKNLIIEILVQHFPGIQSRTEKELPLWFESLLTVIQKEEHFTKGLSNLYEISGRSPGHINRVFRQLLNMTPTEYLNGLRLNYCKFLLATTNLSIMDICFKAGFGNLSHFYHLFGRSFKITPLEFRSKSIKSSSPSNHGAL